MANSFGGRDRSRVQRRHQANESAPESAEKPAHPLLNLQRKIGNLAVQRMLQREDALQREDDEEEIAMKRDPALQRVSDDEEEIAMKRDPALQRDSMPQIGMQGGETDAGLTGQINNLKGSGTPISEVNPGLARKAESAMGIDTSGITVNTSSAAHSALDGLGAKAANVGDGQTILARSHDESTLAHEMAHFHPSGVAPASASPGGVQRKGFAVTSADNPAESFADDMASKLTSMPDVPTQRHAEEDHK